MLFNSFNFLFILSKPIKNDFVTELLVAALLSVLLFPIYEYVFLFLLGYFLYRYGKRFLFGDIVMSISFCLFVVLFTLYRETGGQDMSLLIRLVMALAAIMTVVGFMRRLDVPCDSRIKICELLCFIGRHSLEIYLLHYYFAWICRDMHISVVAIHAIPLYVIVFAVALLICVLSSYIAEGMKKIPYVSFFLFGGH